jgi:ABC-2 type transport system ATP-binding protein
VNTVEISGLSKQYGKSSVLDGIDLSIPAGRIVGLVGPNGAGKTTLLRSILGLTDSAGRLDVLGLDPRTQRKQVMGDTAFIADTAVLPRWMRVDQLIDFVEGVQPNFERDRATQFLSKTNVKSTARIGSLSKGMVVQLHLAITLAINARLLILDEPTLGLDILYRKQFFDQLLNDYFDSERTIIISTHQVEEVQHILTDFIFLNKGRLLLEAPVSDLEERFVELQALGDNTAKAAQFRYMGARNILGGKAFIFDQPDRAALSALGQLSAPSLSDLFVAAIEGVQS